jgi:bifunctional DNA-binding transcriptional regulator/antitoxin component of YhaV-PrlF toxin-antitoxin module
LSKEELIKVTRVYGRGRTQIPSEIVKALELKEGDKIVWFMNESGVFCIRKVPTLRREHLGKYIITEKP